MYDIQTPLLIRSKFSRNRVIVISLTSLVMIISMAVLAVYARQDSYISSIQSTGLVTQVSCEENQTNGWYQLNFTIDTQDQQVHYSNQYNPVEDPYPFPGCLIPPALKGGACCTNKVINERVWFVHPLDRVSKVSEISPDPFYSNQTQYVWVSALIVFLVAAIVLGVSLWKCA